MSHDREQPSSDVDSPHSGGQITSSLLCPTLPLPLDPAFVSRPDIVEWLHRRSAQAPGRLALVGPSGVGKTQLAVYYAQSIQERLPQTKVFWVQASARVSFQESYGHIARFLQLQEPVDDQFGRLQQVYDALTNDFHGPWLLILDDANDIEALTASFAQTVGNHPTLASFLPANANGSVIITSCAMDVVKILSSEDDIYNVPAMDGDQAIQLAQKKIEEEDVEVKLEFVEALNRMPLAISQAAAYMNAQTPLISMRTYLDQFQEYHGRETHVLNQGCDISSQRGIHAGFYSIATAWHISFDHVSLERPSAADLLQFMSFSNPQRIQGPMARHYNQSHRRSDDALDQDIEILCKCSLLAATSEDDIFQMHTALQLCIQMWLSANNPQEWRQKCLTAMSNSWQPKAANQDAKQAKYSQTIIWDQPPRAHFGLSWAKLLSSVGWYRLRTGNYGGAEHALQDSMTIMNETIGQDDLAAIAIESMLAAAYQGLGKFQAAEAIHRRALNTRTRVLGSEHADTLLSESNLATALQHLGKYAEAEQIHRRIYDIRERILGPYHMDTMTSANNSALQIKYQGRYEEAEQIIREVFQESLDSLDNLATTLQKQAKYEEAEMVNRRALNARQRVLGPDHPDTLTSLYNLAYLLHQQGQVSNAVHLYGRAYAGFEKVLGRHHPTTKACGAHYNFLRSQTQTMALGAEGAT